MSAVILDFFEYKYNGRVVATKGGIDRLKDFLEMELAEALAVSHPVEEILIEAPNPEFSFEFDE